MWKLTITQKRLSEILENRTIEESVVFTDNNIINLTSLIDKLSGYDTAVETRYKIENVGDKKDE